MDLHAHADQIRAKRDDIAAGFLVVVNPASIQTLCEAAGFTQAELAERAGLSQATISRIATGRRPEVKLATMAAITTVLLSRLSVWRVIPELSVLVDPRVGSPRRL